MSIEYPLSFLETPRQEPMKKPVEHRRQQFAEIQQDYQQQEAKAQASRCLDCGNPYCEWQCPVHNYIPNWLQLLESGQLFEAARLSHETNTLPEVCGRVCPQDRLCEGACTLNGELGAVTIGALEKTITERAFAAGWKPDLSHVKATGKRVAVIGAGPAGLGCADILLRHGVKPVVFDRYPMIGGLLTFGIPPFKLEKSVMIRRQQLFTELGVEFRFNSEVGRDISLQSLLDDFDGVFLGIGAYRALDGGFPLGPKVTLALPYLIGNVQQLMQSADPLYPYLNLQDQRVLVLGGGDTAMDCTRTAIRQGARSVTCLYRRDEANMPGSRKEVTHAREEGVVFEFNQQPMAIKVSNDRVAVQVVTTQLAEATPNGRQRAEPIAGSERWVVADQVILAFGFQASPPNWLQNHGILCDSAGRIKTKSHGPLRGQTTQAPLFAGGDAVRGADLVVTAIDEGRQAGYGLLHYLKVI